MELALETRSPSEARADVLVLGQLRRRRAARAGDRRAGPGARRPAFARAEEREVRGQAGSDLLLPHRGRDPRRARAGGGARPAHARRAGARRRAHAPRHRRGGAARARPGRRHVAVFMPGAALPARERAQAVVEGARARHLSLRQVPEGEERQGGPRARRCIEPDRRSAAAARDGVRIGRVAAEATCLARDLVNEPANVVTPTFLAPARGRDRRRRAGSPCASSTGPSAPRWAWAPTWAWRRAARSRPSSSTSPTPRRAGPRRRVVVIGKGITFDSGGLDLKTADGMLRMKDDMSGAAPCSASSRPCRGSSRRSRCTA